MSTHQLIYLDYQATTPLAPEVLDAITPYLREEFGNPHATSHAMGRSSANAIEHARHQMATAIGAERREIVFTSGATEANNLILRNAVRLAVEGGRQTILTCPTEHKAVLEVLSSLAREGIKVRMVPVGEDGLVELQEFSAMLSEDVGLVSIMTVNNEIGVIQPIEKIGQICRAAGVPFHTDAAQALGRVPLEVGRMNVDFMSISGHKTYGPKGVGAAYISRSFKRQFEPLIVGGAQEGGLRGGTLPTPLIVGLGCAAELAVETVVAAREHAAAMRDRFLAVLDEHRVSYTVNGSLIERWPGNLNISFSGIDAEALVTAVYARLAISTGSACTAASLAPSHVLKALGLDDERMESAVRIGFGRPTRLEEVDEAARLLAAQADRLSSIRRVA